MTQTKKNKKNAPTRTSSNTSSTSSSSKPVAWRCNYCKALFYTDDESDAHREKCKTYPVIMFEFNWIQDNNQSFMVYYLPFTGKGDASRKGERK